MRYVGGSTVDQFERFGFKHETKEFLIWPGTNVKSFVTKNQPIVNIPDVTDQRFGSFEPSLGMTQSVDDVKLKTVLEPFGGKDIFDDLRCEFVFGTSPECSKPNLGIGVHGRFLQKPFPGMEN